jgi:hypothetical protein
LFLMQLLVSPKSRKRWSDYQGSQGRKKWSTSTEISHSKLLW